MLVALNLRSLVSAFAENTVLEPGSKRQSPSAFTSSTCAGSGSQCTEKLPMSATVCPSSPVTGGALMPLLTRACVDATNVDGANVVPSKGWRGGGGRYVGHAWVEMEGIT